MTAQIDHEKCGGCGECISSCPLDCISLDDAQEDKAVIESCTCGDCGACIDICPVGAISLG